MDTKDLKESASKGGGLHCFMCCVLHINIHTQSVFSSCPSSFYKSREKRNCYIVENYVILKRIVIL